MESLQQFLQTYVQYTHELWWSVLLGFFLSGLLYEFIPENFVEKYLSQDGLKPILISSLAGVILPVCCFGSLPIAVTLRNKGARLGPVLAFLVATPATSVSALIVCWKLLGAAFTLYIFIVVVIMGLVIGIIGNQLKVNAAPSSPKEDCCHEDAASQRDKTLTEKLKGSFVYAFITLPKEIGLELLLGIAVASFLIIFEPAQEVIRQYLSGALGYAFILIVGLITYVCSTASVPMADAFIKSGLSVGQSMTYLLVGPITSYGTIFVLRKEFGWKVLGVYLATISISSLAFGLIFDALLI